MPRARDIERRSRSTVFIAEGEDATFNGRDFDHYFTGRFWGHLDTGGPRITQEFADLSLADALDWARERADRVVVHIGSDAPYVIGGRAGAGRVAWPEGGVPQPERRRFPGEEWKDRTDADPDIAWTATVALAPPTPPAGEEDDRRRPEWDAVVEAAAATLAATWSGDSIDGWYADLGRARRAALRRGSEDYGWATSYTRSYLVTFTVQAPTHARAVEAATGRVPAVPPGWRARVDADVVRT